MKIFCQWIVNVIVFVYNSDLLSIQTVGSSPADGNWYFSHVSVFSYLLKQNNCINNKINKINDFWIWYLIIKLYIRELCLSKNYVFLFM